MSVANRRAMPDRERLLPGVPGQRGSPMVMSPTDGSAGQARLPGSS
jgi:hypothetical protein